MKIILLLLTLLQQDDFLLKQGVTSVGLGDLDAYVYLLPPEKRAGFVVDENQIEKNLITILNMNIVYDHVINSELNDLPTFNKVAKLVADKVIDLDDEFYMKLGLEQKQAESSVRSFIEKKEYYARMLEYLKTDLLEGRVDQLAKEYFLVNKSQWLVPEKRELSVILINKDSEYYSEVENIMNELIENPSIENFESYALKYSAHPSVKKNKGNLSYFTKKSFNMPFVDHVFSAPQGVVSSIYKYKKDYYLVRVNDIIPQKQADYAEHENKIKQQLTEELVDKKFQNIINTQANNKIEINSELMAHVFERYKVFIEQ